MKSNLKIGLAAGAALAATAGVGTAVGMGVRKAQGLHTAQGRYGKIRCFTIQDAHKRPIRAMSVGGVFQSATYLDSKLKYELPFEYLRAFDVYQQAGIDSPRVCMLGGGGYAYPKYAVTHYPDVKIDVVENDPVVTSMALRYFFLDEVVEEYGQGDDARLNIVHADAIEYLVQSKGCYDVVIDDVFQGASGAGAHEDEWMLRTAKAALKEGGIYIANVVDAEKTGEPVDAALDACSELFAHVQLLPCSDEMLSDSDNFLVIASDENYVFGGVVEHRCGFPEDADEGDDSASNEGDHSAADEYVIGADAWLQPEDEDFYPEPDEDEPLPTVDSICAEAAAEQEAGQAEAEGESAADDGYTPVVAVTIVDSPDQKAGPLAVVSNVFGRIRGAFGRLIRRK